MGFSELAKIFCMAVATFRKWRWEYWYYPETEANLLCFFHYLELSFVLNLAFFVPVFRNQAYKTYRIV